MGRGTEMEKEPFRDQIIERIQNYQRQIESCPHCAMIRKAIVEFYERLPPEPLIMNRADIDERILKQLEKRKNK